MLEIIKNLLRTWVCMSSSNDCKKEQDKIGTLELELKSITSLINLKNEEISALNIKLNSYTMDYDTMLEKIKSNVYLYNPKDIKLEPGIKIELMDLVNLMKTFGATAMTYIDSYYFSIEPEIVSEVLKQNTAIDKSEYIPEGHDCDDFAFALLGLFSQEALSGYAFGWARSSNHAFNFFIDKNKEIWIVEPQNSGIMKYSDILNWSISSNGQENNLDYKITQYLI